MSNRTARNEMTVEATEKIKKPTPKINFKGVDEKDVMASTKSVIFFEEEYEVSLSRNFLSGIYVWLNPVNRASPEKLIWLSE